MRDINELNEKIADLEKQRDALVEAEKTGGFKVGDKVVIEGMVIKINNPVKDNHPIKVEVVGSFPGADAWVGASNLRHAEPAQEPIGYVNIYEDGNWGTLCDTAERAKQRALAGWANETAVPVYRTPPAASKRIAELENRCEKIKAEARRWKEAYQERVERGNSANTANIDVVCDLVEARKEIEDLQDMLCKKKFDELVPTGDDVATDHIVEPNKMVVAPKGVKEEINHILDGIRFGGYVYYPSAIAYISKGMVDGIRDALSEIVELPEPNKYVAILESSCGGFDVLMDNHFWFFVNSHNALPLAAALVQAAQKADPENP